MATAAQFTPEELQQLKVLNDPVAWAKVYLNWTAYDYQEPILHGFKNKKKVVLRLGRRLGKCLPEWVEILDPITGELVTVGELFKRGKANVATMTDNFKIKQTTTNIVFENGIKEVFRVTLKSGRQIDATDNHPLYTTTGWQEIGKLRPGDNVAIPNKLNFFGNLNIPDQEIILIVKEKEFNKNILKLTKEKMFLYLQELYNNTRFVFDNSKDCHRVQHLLLRFGIKSIIKDNQVIFNQLIENNNIPDIGWDKIISIESIGYHQTYDLTIPETHNFIANDIVTHNSETMAITILWHAMTQVNRGPNAEQYDILIICPYETQVDLVFERLNQLIDSSPYLTSCIKNRTQHNIIFNNSTDIKGLTAGSKSNTGANNVRGQRADLIVLDESDYLSVKDLGNVINIRNEDPTRIKIIAASTPTGKRGPYYKWCINANNHKGRVGKPNGWWEFYAPSTVNKKLLEIDPDTGVSFIDQLKDELSENDFEKEVMANFGEEMAGVYAKRHLDAAMALADSIEAKLYTTQNPPIVRRGPRIAGIDWDIAQATPSIIGMEFDLHKGIYVILYKEEIPKSKFTLSYAVQRIIESDAVFNWNWIYLDRGMGELQLEQLKLHGINNNNMAFAKKIRGVYFSEKVKVRDPITKKIDKKPIKPFMVKYSVRAYEKNCVALPYDKKLVEQLENYRVEKISSSGAETYTNINEHFVDAQNLCFLGFAEKYDKLIRQRISSKVMSVPQLDRRDDQVRPRELAEVKINKIKLPGKKPSVMSISTPKPGRGRGGTGRTPSRKSF